ncbi:MAG: Stp1/IreP family PP2C-type Ser/Thr phosphatase [bacterium]
MQTGTPTAPQKSVVVHVFGRTDVGRMREHNEDAFVVADLTRGNATLQPEVRTHVVGERGTMFMIADGMGGAAAGEIASAMAVETVLREVSGELAKTAAPTEDSFASAIKRATSMANAEIHMFAVEHPEFRGMGTTATVAGVLGDYVFVAQVGDSRAYLVRDGQAQQITKDQSLMQKLIEAGELTEEEAEQSERRNIILQALGPEAQIKIDLTHQQLREGDTLVLCSDGLSGQVKTDEIARTVTEERDLTAACKRLIDRANENGGPDNITVIVARFEGDALRRPSAQEHVGHRVFPLSVDSGQTPAVELPRHGTVTTGSMSAHRRPTLQLPPDAFTLTPNVKDETAAKRRSRGTMAALMFLVAFLAIATWVVYRSAEQLVENKRASPPPASDSPTPQQTPAAALPASASPTP